MAGSKFTNAFFHDHTFLETCPPSCEAHKWWEHSPGSSVFFKRNSGGYETNPAYKPATQNQAPTPAPEKALYGQQVSTKAPIESFDPKDFYPRGKLDSGEEAFLWYAKDAKGEEGDVYTHFRAHWGIIENISKKNIYEFLKDTENSPIPMLWGYTVLLTGNKMYVKFLTHISPGKQDLEYIQPCIKDLEQKYKRTVIDYDIEDTKTPILESYTPSGSNLIQEQEQELKERGWTETPYAGEFKNLRKDVLNDGTTVITSFIGNMAPDPESPFETIVLDPGELQGQTKETHYASSEKEALNNHYRLVDLYNKQIISKAGSTVTHEPFMFHNNTLHFGNFHHTDILNRVVGENPNWAELSDDPPVFGWYYKPTGAVNFATDANIQAYDTEKRNKAKQLLEYKFGKPVTEDPDAFTFDGWVNNHIPATSDVTWDEYEKNGGPSQMKLFAHDIHPGQLSLFEKHRGINTIKVNPGEDFHHSEGERPFIYHVPSKSLFYTTQDCHHYHISDLMNQHLSDAGYEPGNGPYVVGDITDPEIVPGRNWIKFISSDVGHYPESVINFLQDKFGPRDVIVSGEGWEPISPHQILKEPEKISNTSRKERLAEWRWSYDPDTRELDVWEINNGYPNHFQRTGSMGQRLCVQGRVYLLPENKFSIFYWQDRPWSLHADERAVAQEEGWTAINQWVNNNIRID